MSITVLLLTDVGTGSAMLSQTSKINVTEASSLSSLLKRIEKTNFRKK